jgi:hypothetical protein
MNERDKNEALRMGVEKDIDEIFEPISEQFEVTERLDKLNKLGIGRAFLHVNSEESIRMMLAYSIPMDYEQSKHVVIFRDGEVMVTEADAEYNKRGYIHNLGPSEVNFNFNTPDLSLVKRSFMFDKDLKSKVVRRSTNKVDIPAIQFMLKDALEIGFILKKEREEAIKESPEMVIKTLDDFLDVSDAPKADGFYELNFNLEKEEERQVVEADDIPYGNEE